MEAVVGRLELDPAHGLDPVRPRRRRQVVEQRAAPGEALDAEQLLGVQAAVGRAVLGVALRRDAAAGDVVHADWPPRSRRPVYGARHLADRRAYSRAMSEQPKNDAFRLVLTGEHKGLVRFRTTLGRVPSSPRCKLCMAPFSGPGGVILRRVGFGRFPANPAMCTNCITGFRKEGLTGAEIPVSMLFADVRGSTGIAENLRPSDFRAFLDRFYRIGSKVILDHDGLVDKLVGDEVIGLFFGGVTGPEHAAAAIDAGIELVRRGRSIRRDAERSDPDRGGRPHRDRVRRRNRPPRRGRRLHGARRPGQHDGASRVDGSRRRAPRQPGRGRSRRSNRRLWPIQERGGAWPPGADRRGGRSAMTCLATG